MLRKTDEQNPGPKDDGELRCAADDRDRVFAIDIEVCRCCGGRLRVIASIEDPEVIERILEHLGRDGASVELAHPGHAQRRRRQSRAPPEVGRLI